MHSDRYQRHQQIDWFSQQAVSATRVAVVGAGAIGNEVVKNLVLLGVGGIDLYDFDTVESHNLTRSVFLRESDIGTGKATAVVQRAATVDAAVQLRAFEGDFWDRLSVWRLREYDCAIGAVDNFEARIRLNQMCLIAGTNFVNAAIDSRHVVVESFPFGDAWGGACYECHLPLSAYERMAARYSCGGLRRRAQASAQVPTTAVTASVAGALAASTALRLGRGTRDGERPHARRVLMDTIAGTSTVSAIDRNAACAACEEFTVQPDLVRTRNSWSLAPEIARAGPAALEQVLRLSDPLLIGYECARCGSLEEAARFVNRRAAEFDDAIVACPRCAAPAVRVEIRQRFALGELVERFGPRPVPVKFALAAIDGRTICFDFEEE
jgi:molybdopterin/thiamine biosynthesis adenylyltransferase